MHITLFLADFFLQLCHVLINILENRYQNFVRFIITSLISVSLCFQEGVYTIQKGPRIRVSFYDPQENTGVICEADGIPFRGRKKEAARRKTNFSVWTQGFAMKRLRVNKVLSTEVHPE